MLLNSSVLIKIDHGCSPIRSDSDVIVLNQILALNEAIRQASSSVDCDNSAAISPEHVTSLSLSPSPIRTSKPREKGRIWDNIVSNIQTSDAASPVLKERSKASIQQKWDAGFQKYRY
ncbi:unnamed protein product [Rhizophagus irregularis]|uniref:Uncharacterized protein n=1 Tax=Rhizophagus irregularis TaxID=588596 RepID=A0A2N1N291_9GLOM|nr:hypothetical protein RhiirC2_782837 [Rhizophagus irregularis]CAB5390829.1 unnamed protein product [Rhizophagus irregularis]